MKQKGFAAFWPVLILCLVLLCACTACNTSAVPPGGVNRAAVGGIPHSAAEAGAASPTETGAAPLTKTGSASATAAGSAAAASAAKATEQDISAALISSTPEHASEESAANRVSLSVDGRSFTATLDTHPTAQAFRALLPVTMEMGELNGNEKFFFLQNALTEASQSVGSIQSGDIMLYGSDCLVLFYESFSTPYSYTRLGTVDDPTGLAQALGAGSVTVTWAEQ